MQREQDNEREEPEPDTVDGWTIIDNRIACKVIGDALILSRYYADGPDENGDPVYRLGGVLAGVGNLPALRRLLESSDEEASND